MWFESRRGAGSTTDRHYVIRQRIVNLAAAVSLALCVASVALWVSSYWKRLEAQSNPSAAGEVSLFSVRGSVVHWQYWRSPSTLTDPNEDRHIPRTIPQQIREHAVPGFTITQIWLALDPAEPTNFTFRSRRSIVVRYWLLAMLWSVLPAISLVRAARHRQSRRRLRGGLCLTCGYNLRATPDRCPECGAVPEPPHSPPL